MKLGFVILAHNQPASIRRLTDILTRDGDQVVIHFDPKASEADQHEVLRIAADKPDLIRVISKVHCVWGDWSLVEAVLMALGEFAKMPDPPDYVHLMSGADCPIRPTADLKEFLLHNPGLDFIECCDISQKSWVKDGLEKERFHFYFPFNSKIHPGAFNRSYRWQGKLKVRRRMPLGLKPHMGSQWWTLRWDTCSKVLEFTAKHPEVPRFFRSTWIPDESYFQTVIAGIIPRSGIADLQLMFHHLTPRGRPYIFYNDHLPLIRRLPHFFIRKVSPEASDIWDCLGDPGCKPRRIPTRKHLTKARDLVRSRIDANHQFTGNLPGHPDSWYGPELRMQKRPMILLLATDEGQLARIEETVSRNPECTWLGRPYAPKSINMPDAMLARVGLSRSSWKVRDNFRQQFLHLIIENAPLPGIPVAVVVCDEDVPDLNALTMLDGMLPLIVRENSLKSLSACSRFISASRDACPAFVERSYTVDQMNLSSVIESLANDRPDPQGLPAGAGIAMACREVPCVPEPAPGHTR